MSRLLEEECAMKLFFVSLSYRARLCKTERIALIYFTLCLPVLAVSLIRLIEVAILFFIPDGVGGVGLASKISVFAGHQYVLAGVLLVSALLALFSVIRLPYVRNSLILYLLAPQQLFVTMASFGAIVAVWNGMYADGTVRSSWFILADQSPRIAMFVFHAFSIVGLWRLNHILNLRRG